VLNPNYLELVKAQLTQFATQANFESVLTTAFGTKIDRTKVLQLRQKWLKGDFSLIPPIEVLTNGELGNANGGYAGSEDKIFVSSDFLAQNQNNSKAITGLLLEEFGHKIDRFFNGDVDSAGDEGDIFSRLVSGQILSAQTLAGLKAEDDTAVIIVDGRVVSIEMEDWTGTSGDDTHFGLDDSNNLKGGDGDDTLLGGGGIDNLAGQNGNDDLYGNEGDDYLDGGTGNDYLFGQIGDDDLYGGIGNDNLYGGSGDDYLDGGAGSDTIYAGAGDDRIRGIGKDTIDGEEGEDFLFINNSADTANTKINSTINSTLGTIDGGSSSGTTFKSIESVYFLTGSGKDTIDISSLRNFSSDNYIFAGAGDDTINGGHGFSANTLYGGAGNDKIVSTGVGVNKIFGGTGNDEIVAGSFNDTVDGEDGNDKITSDQYGVHRLSGGAGNDEIRVTKGDNTLDGGDGNDYIGAGVGNDTINGGAGNDRIVASFIISGGGKDTIDGGSGNDLLYASNYYINPANDILYNPNDTRSIDINYTSLANGKITGGALNGTTFKNIESVEFITVAGDDEIYVYAATGDSYIYSGGGNDNIWTGSGNDYINGGTGNDYIRSGNGNDTILGEYGNDTIYASYGNDIINGGAGNDTIDGGEGNDTISAIKFFNQGIGKDTIDGGNGKDILNFEEGYSTIITNVRIEATSATSGKVTGGSGNGTTFKNIESVNLTTGYGNDYVNIAAFGGDNKVDGSEGADFIYTGAGNDTIYGGGGNDVLLSGAGNDTIYGGSGKDYIDGWDGIDRLNIYNYFDTVDTTTLYRTANDGKISGGGSNGTTFKNIESVNWKAGSGYDYIDLAAATGNNTVDAGGGNDYIRTSIGKDTINGGIGDDTLEGGTGADILDGGAGNDHFYIRNESDIANTTITYLTATSGTISGGLNNGTTFKNIETSAIWTGSGNDKIDLAASTIFNYVESGAGNDTINGGSGNDQINAGKGVDIINGGGGKDLLNIGNFYYPTLDTANTTILYTTTLNGTVAGGYSNGTTFKNIETIEAQTGSGKDKIDISAATGDNSINANAGNDTLISGVGNDNLIGGAGNDTMIGGAGDDRYSVDSASDIVTENANGGNDTIFSSAFNYTLALNVETLNLIGSANGTGNSGHNIISGYSPIGQGNLGINNNNVINGGAGNDTLNGGIGNDTYIIDADVDLGNDTIYEYSGTDTIDFSTTTTKAININLNTTTLQAVATGVHLVIPVVSIENVTGGTLNDTLTGNNLNNMIDGGAGNDKLTGGVGDDSFLFDGGKAISGLVTVSSLLGKDTIADFNKTPGTQDKIVLSKGTFTNITAAAGAAIGANFASFASDALAGSSEAAIVYNTTTGNLIYNHNGAEAGFGANGGVFASIDRDMNAPTPLTIVATDFSIVA
jgi:Ca2+-binding RTX toxin-like protein